MDPKQLKEYEAQFFRYMVKLATHRFIKPLVVWDDYNGIVTFEFTMSQDYLHWQGGEHAKAAALALPEVVLAPVEFDKV